MSVEVQNRVNIEEIRAQFPVLHQEVNGKPLVYFDNAATSQKPKRVIDALSHYYENDNANIHRGIHTLAERATTAYENTRSQIAEFINANEKEEVIFTKGTTESINLVAQSYGRKFLKPGDVVLISAMEHHSNIVPWQLLCQQTGAQLRIAPINEKGELIWEEYEKLLDEKVKIVSQNYISNTLGTINPVEKIVDAAHKVGAVVMLDAAQAISHLELDVQKINCDFIGFSGHKMYGPTGVGVLYGKRRLLEKMDPYQGGGEMISNVSFEKTDYNDIPYKFEAGTPNIADVIALDEAIKFMKSVGVKNMMQYEDELLRYGTEKLNAIEGFQPVGIADFKASVISFNIESVHSFDLGMLLDTKGIAIRTGHHCTQPLMDLFGIEGTARASFAVYNTIEEIDYFVDSLVSITEKLRK